MIASQQAERLAIPTTLSARIYRLYAGKSYSRESMVFGEKEVLRLECELKNALLLPVINAPIKVYVDGRLVATITTNVLGLAEAIFEEGIPKGDHVITCVWEGDFWNAPSSAKLTLRTVRMVESYFKVYVDSLTASPATVEAGLMDNLLNQDVGAVIIKSETDLERVRYIFTILVPEENTTMRAMLAPPVWALIAIIVLSVAAVLAAYAAAVYVTVAYVLGEYQCGICGQRFLTCEALREHLIAQHPEVWEKIEDRYECAPPAPPFPWEWLIYGGMGILGIIAVASLIRALR